MSIGIYNTTEVPISWNSVNQTQSFSLPGSGDSLIGLLEALLFQLLLAQQQGDGLWQLVQEMMQEGEKLKGENNPLGQQLIDLANQLMLADLTGQNNPQLAQQLLTDASQLLSTDPGLAMEMIGEALSLIGSQQTDPTYTAWDNSYPYYDSGSSSNSSPYVNYAGNGQPVSGGQKVQAKQIYNYLISKYHLTPAQAAGILGNMQVESGLNTGALNSAEGAIGLCQWEGGRRTALEQYAASQGKPVTDWQVQVDFMMKEMGGSESGAYSMLKSATTPAQAAAIFDQYFERSSGSARAQREADAVNFFNMFA
jgi:hypothetical protein